MAASACMESLPDRRAVTIDRRMPISVPESAVPTSSAPMGRTSDISPAGMTRSNNSSLATAGSIPTSATIKDASTMRT